MRQRRLRLSTFQIGAPPKRGEGLRIGTTRRPPRGVRRQRWQRDGYFDVWLPVLAPSAALLRRTRRRARNSGDPAIRRQFFEAYERELDRLTRIARVKQFLAIIVARHVKNEFERREN